MRRATPPSAASPAATIPSASADEPVNAVARGDGVDVDRVRVSHVWTFLPFPHWGGIVVLVPELEVDEAGGVDVLVGGGEGLSDGDGDGVGVGDGVPPSQPFARIVWSPLPA